MGSADAVAFNLAPTRKPWPLRLVLSVPLRHRTPTRMQVSGACRCAGGAIAPEVYPRPDGTVRCLQRVAPIL